MRYAGASVTRETALLVRAKLDTVIRSELDFIELRGIGECVCRALP